MSSSSDVRRSLLAGVAFAVALSIGAAADVDPDALERERILRLSPLPDVPRDPSNAVADDERAARLGRALFYEPRLSPAAVSCATCHVPAHGFSDGKPVSEGIARGRRRTPALWNVAFNRWFFWDGRADSLWSQALGPLESPAEMGGSRAAAAQLVQSDPRLRTLYEAAFGTLPQEAPDKVFVQLGKAIAAFERRIVSRDSPFDRYVADLRAGRASNALTPAARRGLSLFVGRGNCRVCHSGPTFTDGEFHDTGIEITVRDAGRYDGIAALQSSPFSRRGPHSDAHTGDPAPLVTYLQRTPESWGQFKTPALRNVALHAPYMHQGQLATLRDVVRFYSERAGLARTSGAEKILRPLHLTDAEIDDLVAFLESLTDDSALPGLMDK